MVDTITHNAPSGSKYDVWNENGVPVGLKTKDGRMIPEASINKNDPDADELRSMLVRVVTPSHAGTRRTTRQAIADRHAASSLLVSSRPSTTEALDSSSCRVVERRGRDAHRRVRTTRTVDTSGGKPDVESKARQKWSNVFKDVRRAANKNLSANCSSDDEGPAPRPRRSPRLAAAMHENHVSPMGRDCCEVDGSSKSLVSSGSQGSWRAAWDCATTSSQLRSRWESIPPTLAYRRSGT
jgi:hypothetical protein